MAIGCWELVGWIVSAAALGAAAVAMACLLNPVQPRLAGLSLLFWFPFFQASAVGLAGLAGFLVPAGVALISVAFGAGLAVCTPGFRWCVVASWRFARRFVAAVMDRNPGLFWIGVGFVGILCMRQLVVAWFLPPHVYDVLTYHLPKVADWIQTGALVANPTPVVRSFWPANFELLQAWYMVFLHHDAIVELAGIPFWILGAGSVYSIARSVRAGRSSAAWGGLAFFCTPVFFQNAVGGKNDVAIAGLFLFAIACLLEWSLRPRNTLALGVPALAAWLLAIGIKPTILFMTPAFVAWIAIRTLGAKAPLPGMDGAGSLSVVGPNARRAITLVLLLALGMASYWYLRNWVLFNNPFHPTDFKLFGRLVFGEGHGSGQQGGFRLASAVETLRQLWSRRLLDPGPFSPDVGSMSGWGWFSYAVGIPSVVLACRRREFAGLALMFGVAGVLLLAFVDADPWNMRFMQWFPALFGIGFAVALDLVRLSPVRNGMKWLAATCLVLNVLGSLNNGWLSLEDWRYHVRTPWRERAVATGYEKAWRQVPAGQKLGYFMAPNDPVYLVRGPGLQREAVFLRVDSATKDFAAAADRQGLLYILYPEAQRDLEWRTPFDRQCATGRFEPLEYGLFRRLPDPDKTISSDADSAP